MGQGGFHKKASASGGLCLQTRYQGSAPGPRWGTSSPKLHPPDPLQGLRPWTSLGSPDPQSCFMSANNPMRSTPLGLPHLNCLSIYRPVVCFMLVENYLIFRPNILSISFCTSQRVHFIFVLYILTD